MGFIGAMRPLGGGVRGGGNPSGCGGGTSFDVGEIVAGFDECVFESNASSDTPDCSFELTKGDNVGETNPDPVSDGCMNGFADGGGLWSMSSSGTTSTESLDLRARWLPSPPADDLLVCRFDRSTLALRVTSPSKDGPPPPPLACADSRAALRRSRSAISHRRRFSSTRRVSAASSFVGGYESELGFSMASSSSSYVSSSSCLAFPFSVLVLERGGEKSCESSSPSSDLRYAWLRSSSRVWGG